MSQTLDIMGKFCLSNTSCIHISHYIISGRRYNIRTSSQVLQWVLITMWQIWQGVWLFLHQETHVHGSWVLIKSTEDHCALTAAKKTHYCHYFIVYLFLWVFFWSQGCVMINK